MDICVLYDRLETQLRALETLGVTSDKCSAMLFPLIESCLSPELLSAWQRSASFDTCREDDPTLTPLEQRLKGLMAFLRREVENEERINRATEAFGLAGGSGQSKGERNVQKRTKDRSGGESTALDLLNTNTTGCIFCSGEHASESCFKAQQISLEKRRETVSKKRGCFRCLKIGHQAKQCRKHLKCLVCNRSHVVLMCPAIPAEKSHGPKALSDAAERVLKNDEVVKEPALANYTQCPDQVFLQTLSLTLKGPQGQKTVRASQRSYILRDTAAQLLYRPKRTEQIAHCLFGGSEMVVGHSCYNVTVFGKNRSLEFEVLDQAVICGSLSSTLHEPLKSELYSLGIEISDKFQSGPIELLLGADILGSFFTGKQKVLRCGLVARETYFGWTLVGKTQSAETRSSTVTTTLNLLVNNCSLSELWELETIGIKEPSDKKTKEEAALAARDLFLQTVKVNDEGRYEVRLPWWDDHPPLPDNYQLAQKRLNSAVKKLKSESLFEEYGQIFHEWTKEGIITQLGPGMVDHFVGHYLPHR